MAARVERLGAESTPRPAVRPVQAVERIGILDILRGFALLGILLVNIDLFSHPVQSVVLPVEATLPWFDRAAVWLVRFLAEGKFYSLFSFLFGLGFTLQMSRAEERGARFVPLYLRRLLALLGIGLLHAFFIWVGDILTLYALLGLLLLLYRKIRPRTALIWAAVFLALPILFYGLSIAAIALGRSADPEIAAQIDQAFAAQRAQLVADARQAASVYAGGNFIEITRQRAADLTFLGPGNLFLAPNVFAMFLIGLYFGRRRIFQDITAHLPLFRHLLWWGLPVGLIGNLVYAALIPSLSRAEPSVPLLVAMLGQTVGAPALSLFYVAALTLLSRRAAWQQRLSVLAPVGRMALSNYLGQSIICTLIFYGYGLGLFGQTGRALNLLLAGLIFLIQVLVSNWWMQRFEFGPAEWLWRSVTYLAWQPLQKKVEGAQDERYESR